MGVAALEDRDHHRQLVTGIIEERARLEQALKAFGWTWPTSAGNFLLCQVGPRAGDIYKTLKERGILVRWWDRPVLNEKLRITVGLPEQNDLLIKNLKELV